MVYDRISHVAIIKEVVDALDGNRLRGRPVRRCKLYGCGVDRAFGRIVADKRDRDIGRGLALESNLEGHAAAGLSCFQTLRLP